MPTLVRYWCSNFKSARHAMRIANFFSATSAAGWRNHLVCCGPPADDAWNEPVRRLGVQIVYHPRPRGNFDGAATLRARVLLRDVRCDVLHCDNTHLPPLAGAWLAGVPVRLWSKRYMEPAFEAGRDETFRDRVAMSLRLSCLFATRVLPVSDAIAAELVRKGIPPRKVRVHVSPIQSDPEPAPDRASARAALGLEAGDFVVASVARAVRVKGWDILVRAWARVVRDVPAARLLLVGDAAVDREFRAELDDLIERQHLGAHVRFTGHVTGLGPVLAAADAFVLPSRSEGYGLALVEALRAGLPCVAARVGGIPEIIEHGANGLLFERENDAQLADQLVGLVRDEPLRARLAANASVMTVAPVPSPEEYSTALLEMYTELLSAARRRA